jgi:hypothetical protein
LFWYVIEEVEAVKLVSVVIIKNVTIWLKDVKRINFHVYMLYPAVLGETVIWWITLCSW